MTTNVTLHQGHDVAYFTRGQHRGGCAGAMSYYTAAGEPPGEWAGKGAVGLGLNGQVDPDVIERLYQESIGPGGELLVSAPSENLLYAVARILFGYKKPVDHYHDAKTIERQVGSIYAKLHVANRTQAIKRARVLGLAEDSGDRKTPS